MKQERFEKVVEGDKRELFDTWIFGLVSLFFPITLLFKSQLTFFNLVLSAFLNGITFIIFTLSALNYEDSRKVYWRKMK